MKDSGNPADNLLLSTANCAMGVLIVKTFLKLGVSEFVLSPGSRSTPLVLAVADLVGEFHAHVILDERSAAFRALGIVKGSGRPVVLICTSGTAAANYYPAVIEATESGLPLIICSADRPPELRNCHAGQTIDQTKLYGTYARFFAELPLPENNKIIFRAAREICRRAVETVIEEGGVAHLNIPFREPLTPSKDQTAIMTPEAMEDLLKNLQPIKKSAVKPIDIKLPARTLILTGPEPCPYSEEILLWITELSNNRGCPILADGCSGLRYQSNVPLYLSTHYEWIARQEIKSPALQPEAVLIIGEPPTSKFLRKWLMELDLPGYHLAMGKKGVNPFLGSISTIDCPNGILPVVTSGEKDTDFIDAWRRSENMAASTLKSAMKRQQGLFEGDFLREMNDILTKPVQLLAANSLAIRDLEWFMPAGNPNVTPYSIRGANGIDGTASVARGIADGSQQPTILLTGDLAFLHDANGLADAQKSEAGLLIICFNNEGGGIFEMLPVSSQENVFSKFFLTPQTVKIEHLARAYGWTYETVENLDTFSKAMQAWDGQTSRIIEVTIHRHDSIEKRKNLLKLKLQ